MAVERKFLFGMLVMTKILYQDVQHDWIRGERAIMAAEMAQEKALPSGLMSWYEVKEEMNFDTEADAWEDTWDAW